MLFPYIFGHNDCFHTMQGLARRLHCSGYTIAVELLNITLMFVCLGELAVPRAGREDRDGHQGPSQGPGPARHG